jgi:hypothetical protein
MSDGIKVEYEYHKPKGFDVILAQRARISDDHLDLSLVELYGALGLTMELIGQLHGVSVRTIGTWKKIPQFKDALKRGNSVADAEVVRSLYQRAVGYKYVEAGKQKGGSQGSAT